MKFITWEKMWEAYKIDLAAGISNPYAVYAFCGGGLLLKFLRWPPNTTCLLKW